MEIEIVLFWRRGMHELSSAHAIGTYGSYPVPNKISPTLFMDLPWDKSVAQEVLFEKNKIKIHNKCQQTSQRY